MGDLSSDPFRRMKIALSALVLLSSVLCTVHGAANVLGFACPAPRALHSQVRMPARTSVLMQGTDTMRRSSGPVERILRFADNVVAGAKEASLADQYLGFYTPEVKKELEPIWRRGGTTVLNARDRATADLSDTYESPAITDTSLRTAWKMSSQLSEHEAFDMQNKWPDSFM